MVRFPLSSVLLAVSIGCARSDNVMYPDWSGGSMTCLNGTTTPSGNYLFITDNGYLEETLVSCCSRYYGGTSYNTCIEGGGGTLVGTDQFYADWTSSPQKCAKDCPVADGGGCGGILGPGVGSQYATVALCCSNHFGSLSAGYCAAISAGGGWGGSGEFYLDASENICVQDCGDVAPCGGVVTQSYITLYSDIESCCSNKLPSLNSEFCVAQSTPDSTGTNLWFTKNSLCVKDCVGTGAQCATYSGYGTMYATSSACCAGSLSYLQTAWCESRSDPDTHGVPAGSEYSGMWFVNYNDNVCQKDCDPASSEPACTALASVTPLWTTARSCCDEKLSWIDGATCETVSTSGAATASTGTTKWYADFATAQRCVMDCDVPTTPTCGGIVANTAGESLYDNVVDCCENKFGWYQQDLCKALSEAGVGNDASTGLWYPHYGNEVCVQDCPAGAVEQCEGNPLSLSEPMFADVAACCAAQLGYLDGDFCYDRSMNTATTPSTGTNEWYEDYDGHKCVQDCAVASATPCGGVNTDSWTAMHDTAADCCAAKFNWMNGDLCTARSDLTVSTGLFWPNQGTGICYQDCSDSSSAICSPVTEFSVTLYTSIEQCCSTANSWATTSTCQQIPESESGTSEWYINWTLFVCVKNCAVGQGTSCGGIAATWEPLQPSKEACCSGVSSNYAACLAA